MPNPNNNMNMYNQALQINRDLKKKLDISFTIDEIKEVWTSLANDGIISATDLIEELEQRLK